MGPQIQTFDAMVFEPVEIALVQNPRIHGVFGPGEPIWIRYDVTAALPAKVPAVAIVDGFSYKGEVPTAKIGIGIRTSRIRFEVAGEGRVEP
jgi:hypothetical protein